MGIVRDIYTQKKKLCLLLSRKITACLDLYTGKIFSKVLLNKFSL